MKRWIYWRKQNEPMKVELIEERGGDTVSFYKKDSFMDLCLGPHVPAPAVLEFSNCFIQPELIGAVVKRMRCCSGSTEPHGLLKKIYKNICIELKNQRDAIIANLEKNLNLFHTSDEIGPGLIMWLPKGARVRRQIEDYLYDELFKRGYDVTYTPHVARLSYWETSGHLGFYREKHVCTNGIGR